MDIRIPPLDICHNDINQQFSIKNNKCMLVKFEVTGNPTFTSRSRKQSIFNGVTRLLEKA